MVRVNPISGAAQNNMMSLLSGRVGAVTELSTDQSIRSSARSSSRRPLSLLPGLIGVLIYVPPVRTEFAAAGSLLVHDVLIVLSLFSILQVEINTFIAAILTVVGY